VKLSHDQAAQETDKECRDADQKQAMVVTDRKAPGDRKENNGWQPERAPEKAMSLGHESTDLLASPNKHEQESEQAPHQGHSEVCRGANSGPRGGERLSYPDDGNEGQDGKE
jgi:hypothetical protein